MNIFGKLTGAFLGAPFGLFGLLVGVFFGHLFDSLWERVNSQGPYGDQTQEIIPRIFALFGRISGHGGGSSDAQRLFLQAVVFQQLGLRPTAARQALTAFAEASQTFAEATWTQTITDTAGLAHEIYADYFLDRRTLLWIYATCRQLVSLGTPRPGYSDLLDVIARTFMIFEEVGSASQNSGQQYDQTWNQFRPSAQVGPEAYAVLGLSPAATTDEIKKAYRTLARQYHPDTFAHLPDSDSQKKQAADKFLHLQQAYDRIRQSRKF